MRTRTIPIHSIHVSFTMKLHLLRCERQFLYTLRLVRNLTVVKKYKIKYERHHFMHDYYYDSVNTRKKQTFKRQSKFVISRLKSRRVTFIINSIEITVGIMNKDLPTQK